MNLARELRVRFFVIQALAPILQKGGGCYRAYQENQRPRYHESNFYLA